MSYSETTSYTYTVADIETVMRRFSADIVMIAQSSAAITEEKAREYAHDAEMLAKHDYLEKVDVTLLSNGVEVRAARYDINTASGGLATSRPGGVLWPRVSGPYLRIVLSYTDAYTPTARQTMGAKLKIAWTPTSVDTSHANLKASGARDYVSNGWGLQRKDYAA
ncbi:hypothetical protein RHAL1_P00022 (plasmid) [Beijerinckiaceae bacterium RH AL1]|nr:hypothetical protein [Beijerinckiaceae bacterium]VVB50208.1 hypothetical protein RHCH11_RHCH11_04135 [Beijerinckiaceae bacterium RH CH11]VVB50217.1 hypothetical protein RHAL8_04132 [Beijerinckiaceae bacterium RH AL8]VVC57276.1 hypothetical protein RHAL1_P00022 [Beijerinckiaceae bacterium RH AL1]